jgi:hypothetical protein
VRDRRGSDKSSPGLSALDAPAQIAAWAIVFGYAQQLFTGDVDQQAQLVLDKAGGHDPAATLRARPEVPAGTRAASRRKRVSRVQQPVGLRLGVGQPGCSHSRTPRRAAFRSKPYS